MMANFQRRNLHIRTAPSPRARDEDWDAEARQLLERVNVSTSRSADGVQPPRLYLSASDERKRSYSWAIKQQRETCSSRSREHFPDRQLPGTDVVQLF